MDRRSFLTGATLGCAATLLVDPLMLARRLLATAGGAGGGFTLPAPAPSGTVFELVPSTENVGWVEIPYPQIVTASGKTYFGYINGGNGDVKVAAYDHASQTTSTPFVLHAALGGEGVADNHDNPGLYVRADGKLLAMYCRHAGSALLSRLASSAGDATAFAAEVSTDRGNQHDYPSLFKVGSTLWLLFRNTTSGQNANLCYLRSSDDGATWEATATAVYNGTTGHTPYWRLWHDVPTGLIHVVVTDLEPNTASKLGHFTIDTADGTLRKSDGTTIVASTPLAYADITPIDDGTAGSTQTWGVTMDGSNPVSIYMRHLTNDNMIRMARWTGSAWTTETILASTGGQLGINKFGSGCALNPLAPDHVWIPVKVAGKFEMFEYRKWLGTWTGYQLTSGSSRDQVWPAATFASDGTIDVMWQDVTYTNDTTFGPGAVKAYGTG
jgi:hypothetical protein